MKPDRPIEQIVDAIDDELIGDELAPSEKARASDAVLLDQMRDLTKQMRNLPELDAPLDFTSQVMNRIETIEHPWWIRWRYILTRKHTFRVTPLGAMAGAAGAVFAVTLAVNLLLSPASQQIQGSNDSAQAYLMRFSYSNPQASQVYVAGSFNDWQKEQLPLADNTGSGLWIRVLPIKPGTYEYMFYVDGQWVTDEQAERHKNDGFGRKNAILKLGSPDDIAI